MKQETKRPLYKVLNSQRSSEDNKVAIPAQSHYTELAVNNLHHLAEALEEWLSLKVHTLSNGIETIDANNKTERAAIVKAKEALKHIS